MTQPHALAPPIAWQVYLGCNDAYRLAKELGIASTTASRRLVRAYSDGTLTRISRGRYMVARKYLVSYQCGVECNRNIY